MKNNFTSSPRRLLIAIAVTVLWILSYFSARILLDSFPLDAPLRVVVALLPIPFFALFLMSILMQIRGLDELERRVHLEALVIAFPLAMLLLMTLGLLELAVSLSPDDWSYSHIWPYLALFYFLGLAIARRRYYR